MAKKTGIEAATREAMKAAPAAAGAEPEPALFPEVIEAEEARAGRPAGAVSKRTRDFLEYLDGMPALELPGVWLAKRYSQPVGAILAEAGLEKTAENIRWADGQRQDAAKALAPYVHERRPQAVELEDKRSMTVTLRALDGDGRDVAIDGDDLDFGRLLLADDSGE